MQVPRSMRSKSSASDLPVRHSRGFFSSSRIVASLVLLVVLHVCSPRTAAPKEIVVRGRLLGCDGRPMRSAILRTFGPGRSGSVSAPDSLGAFRIRFPRPGGYFLALSGAYHKTLFLPLLLERPQRLTVRLGVADFSGRSESLRVVGDFNAFSSAGAVPMIRRDDGVYMARIPCAKGRVGYQVLGALRGGAALCGTQLDSVAFDRSRPLLDGQCGSFVSLIVSHSDSVTVRFDPDLLPGGRTTPVVSFADSTDAAARIARIDQDLKVRMGVMMDSSRAFRERGGAAGSFRWDPSPDLRTWSARLGRERDPDVRAYLLLTYVTLAAGTLDSTQARRVFREVAPTSPSWSLLWGGPVNTYRVVSRAAGAPDRVRAYAEEVVQAHPDSAVRAGMLYSLLVTAQSAAQKGRAGRYYTRLLEGFPQTVYAEWAKRRGAGDSVISKGRVVPDFAFKSLDDSTLTYRAAAFSGRYLLLDFWATWCTPCIEQLRYIEEVYRKYRERGLVVLSVSLDESPDAVRRFRARHRAMEWPNAIETRGFASETAEAFKIVGLPRAILVDPKGTIVAIDDELRGDQLGQTLAMTLR